MPHSTPDPITQLQHCLKTFAHAAASLSEAWEQARTGDPATDAALSTGCPFGQDLHELSLEIRSWTDATRIRLGTLPR